MLYAAIFPMFLRKKDYIYAAIAALEISGLGSRLPPASCRREVTEHAQDGTDGRDQAGSCWQTDGSEYSHGAEREAMFIASSCGIDVTVIQVLEVTPEFETEGQSRSN
jgi:hypothetical protein